MKESKYILCINCQACIPVRSYEQINQECRRYPPKTTGCTVNVNIYRTERDQDDSDGCCHGIEK